MRNFIISGRRAAISLAIGVCALLPAAAEAQHFGHTTAYGGEHGGVSSTQIATRVELDADGTLESISAYVRGTPSRVLRFAIYADDNGQPGALLAQTGTDNVGSNSFHWHTLPAPDVQLEAGHYWLAMCFNHNQVYYAYDNAGGATRTRLHNGVSNGFSASWGASATSNATRPSIYATTQSMGGGTTSFGYTTEFASADNDANGDQVATRATLIEAATVNAITAFIKGPPGQHVRYAIYADNDGEPGALIVQSESDQTGSNSFHWRTLPVPATTLDPGVYWLAISAGHQNIQYAYDANGGATRRNPNNAVSSGFTEPWGVSAASNSRRISIYANLVPPSQRPAIVRWTEVGPD